MNRFLKRAAVTTVLTGAIIAVPASSAFAYHCFIAERSVKGAANAGHSANWYSLDLQALVVDLGADPQTTESIMARLDAEGIPSTLAFFEKKLLMAKNPHALAKYGDGKGIESVMYGGYFMKFLQILADHGLALPDDEH